ncbi:LPS-assembly protein LptD [Jannaschia sp. Os4]|uniref:LPS-assembly protein LptD n=1 Tax=Jannaschia sp. Os4 TaxID=2807617 RepID=UPI001939C733|nr:LPS assembly protein LptD [Jannaschia sp. Os4]MBM2577488.1 LPS-assembly protein LptD [Jannaschia sp. Os4]
MTRLLRLLALLCALGAAPAAAQAPASLVADAIGFDATSLTASGNVEVFADGRVLRARRLTYLRDEDRLVVEGPIEVVDPGGDAVLVAEFATLSRDLRTSVLQGARLVLDRQLQLAANEIARDGTGVTQLYQVVASTCEVCPDAPVPIWQIRARRVVHVEETGQIYFERARFEVFGVPVAWFPVLRLPAPTNGRTSGFLAPTVTSDDLLGTGIAVPYFITLGPSRDVTLAPFVTTNEARSLGFRYRQAFDAGAIEVNGALGSDEIRPGEARGYLFAEGTFGLPRDYRLDFDLELVTDDTYLLNYGITEKDRLDSRIAVSRVERDERVLAEAIVFDSLRTGEDNRFLPSREVNVVKERRFDFPGIGGIGAWSLQGQVRERPASVATARDAGLTGAEGARDVSRFSASFDWRRSWVTGGGLVFTTQAAAHFDTYRISDDPAFGDDVLTRGVPYGAVELRYPMTRTGADGAVHTLEPVAQLILAPDERRNPPDEDSLTPEFDEGNLFSLSRFPGRDRRELGSRVNLGVSYRREVVDGWSLGGTVGRVVRDGDPGQFRPGTGLDGQGSDWLLSMDARRGGFGLMARALFDDQLDFNRAETILRWTGPRGRIDTRHTWLESDATAGRPRDTSEWALDASYGLGGDWTGRANWRYDFVTNDPTEAGLGVTYATDCVSVDFDVERRFTSNPALEPSTSYGLSVKLAGLGGQERRTRKRRCGL